LAFFDLAASDLVATAPAFALMLAGDIKACTGSSVMGGIVVR
jgi:hypothetical protein